MPALSLVARFTGPIPVIVGAALFGIVGIVLIVIGGTALVITGIVLLAAAAILALDGIMDLQRRSG